MLEGMRPEIWLRVKLKRSKFDKNIPSSSKRGPERLLIPRDRARSDEILNNVTGMKHVN